MTHSIPHRISSLESVENTPNERRYSHEIVHNNQRMVLFAHFRNHYIYRPRTMADKTTTNPTTAFVHQILITSTPTNDIIKINNRIISFDTAFKKQGQNSSK
jgi:hypothetical protein